MKSFLLGVVAAGALLAAQPASARLQLSITNGTSTFSCADGQLGCDLSGGANNLLLVDTTVGGFFVQIALAQSTFGAHNVLQLSSSNIENNGAAGTVTFVASDTNFLGPVTDILESGSLTFNANIGAGPSSVSFFADPLNAQGANPLNTPGVLLDTVTGTPISDPDSFSGTKLSAFSANSLFSMTETASLNLIAGGSVTGFDQSMTSSSVPEPRTWAMLIVGFALMGAFGAKRRVRERLAMY